MEENLISEQGNGTLFTRTINYSYFKEWEVYVCVCGGGHLNYAGHDKK